MAASSVLYVTAQLGSDLPGTNVTASAPRLPRVTFNTESEQLVIGVILAITANLVISIGLNVQKWVHKQNEARPVADRRPFTASPLWWVGLSGTVVGELGNFMAFGFAGADIVTPLGAVAVVSNAVIACVFLGELFRIRDALGVLLTCLGSVLVVIKAPVNEEEMTVQVFVKYATDTVFVCYISLVLATVAVLWRLLPRVQRAHPAFGLLLCSLLGTVTVLCATALSNFIRVTCSGDQQFGSWVPYILVVVLVPCAVGQVRYLNETMELFDNTQVIPVYYILFTLSTITGSAMLYQDFYQHPADAVTVFVLGCLLCFVGVALLTSGRVSPDDADARATADTDVHAWPLNPAPAAEEGGAAATAASSPDRAKRPQRRSVLMREALRHLDSPMPLPRLLTLPTRSQPGAHQPMSQRDAALSCAATLGSVYSCAGQQLEPRGAQAHLQRCWSEPGASGAVGTAPLGTSAKPGPTAVWTLSGMAGSMAIPRLLSQPNLASLGPPPSPGPPAPRRSHSASTMEAGLLTNSEDQADQATAAATAATTGITATGPSWRASMGRHRARMEDEMGTTLADRPMGFSGVGNHTGGVGNPFSARPGDRDA